jgi:hypothetical protein
MPPRYQIITSYEDKFETNGWYRLFCLDLFQDCNLVCPLCKPSQRSIRRFSGAKQNTPLTLRTVWMIDYWYQFCNVINAVIVTAGTFDALKSDSTQHFFRNACTKSGSLRFSQFSGCWLIMSVYILMSFDFPFGRLFGVG